MRVDNRVASINALFRATLAGGYDGDQSWAAVSRLRRSGNRFIFEKARAWCSSRNPWKRARGADILCQLRARRETTPKPRTRYVPTQQLYAQESFEVFAQLITQEQNDLVLTAILHGFRHLDLKAAVPLVLPFVSHANPDVRMGATCALGRFSDNPVAVDALIRLSVDVDADVRNWATFAIGTQSDIDTPALRDALVQRLEDPSDKVRQEAIGGLAKRRDTRAVYPLFRLMRKCSLHPSRS